ncbi:MAG: tetratricopeptide repeat protein [Sulfuricella denitrificans]|nr:tetratricopeptide repeat protein [Sulfuricella denitrificans]
MAYDLEEQEQIDAIKAWWKQNGNTVLLSVAVFVAIVSGMQGWRYYQHQQTTQAAGLYENLQGAAEKHDAKGVREIAGQLMDRFPRTAYSPRAALQAAKSNYEAGDFKSAKAQLQWVMEQTKSEEIRDTARLQMAGVLLDEKNFTEALKLLESKHGSGFDALYNDLRGDVLLASGKSAEARASYKLALEKMDMASGYRSLVQLKLDGLGG